MNRKIYDIKSILDIGLWEDLQDQIAKLTGTAIITIDYKGTPITKHSSRTEFCSVIRENSVTRKRCFKCDALAGLEAVRLNRPFIYLCHCGIVDVAIPIIVGEDYLGAVMFGQVRVANKETEEKIQRLVSEISSFDAESNNSRDDLMAKYNSLPKMDYERIVSIAEFIESIVKYIVERSVKSYTKMITNEYYLKNLGNYNLQSLLESDVGIQELTSFKRMDSNPMIFDTPIPKSSSIYPSIVYINEHINENILMHDMANLCHLSPSYFSRLFAKQTGENFNNYVNRKKIELAQKLLIDEGQSISDVSNYLGFVDTSYFIKVFKKFVGITPQSFKASKIKSKN